MSLKLHGLGKITGIDQGLSVVGVTTLHNELFVSGDVVVGGGLTVTGVLTYDDVTNIDSIGVVTARNGIDVNAGGIDVVGVVTATSFSGEDLLLSAIDTSLTDIAKDIFVYDTSKDSDGGAWRKRTQHTSWYNETLNTLTRGSRKEFPSVAIIVVEQNQVTIYDGDDPDLPIWMVFNQGQPKIFYINATSASMLNGKLVFGTDPNSANYYDGGIKVIDFISESIRSYSYASSIIDYNLNISQRNDDYTGAYYSNSNGRLTSPNVNDVAMTVLPNAPIDDATGLPVPTIAVGTDGGVSIIKDDGSVVDFTITTSTNNYGRRVDFTDDNRVVIEWDGGTNGEITINEIPSVDTSANYPINLPGSYYNDHSPASYTPNFLTEGPSIDYRHPTAIAQFRAVGTTVALSVFEEDKESEEDGMVAFISSSYNTGYQQGRIKGAFLSDTDTTNVNADTLNSANAFDGTFTTSTGWTTNSDWSIGGGVATCNGADAGRWIYPSTDRWPIGSSVVVEVTVTAYTSGTLSVSYATGGATPGTNMTATGTYKFVNNVTGNDLIYIRSDSFIGSIDNIKIYYAEYDRSLNNKGLIPYGTVTRSAVATGAELVAYSGFTDNDYLKQPYNSDLDFGTGDYYMSIWAKGGGDAQCLMIREHGTYDDDGAILLFQSSNKYHFFSRQNGTGQWTNFLAANATYGNYWSHVMLVRRGGTLYGYVDGELQGSTSFAGDVSNNDAEIYIGRRNPSVDNTQEYSGSLALARIGGSAPSAAQIKKMYEDEKMLFQENAVCTLYGSSDAVTALAYDEVTKQLHVGTSSGRSDFQRLRRINNTTTAVTTAISASDELIAEQ